MGQRFAHVEGAAVCIDARHAYIGRGGGCHANCRASGILRGSVIGDRTVSDSELGLMCTIVIALCCEHVLKKACLHHAILRRHFVTQIRHMVHLHISSLVVIGHPIAH